MKEIFVAAFPKNETCIDEFQPNTIQANYLEGFWRITSKKTGENRGKNAVRIFAFSSPSRQCLAQNSLQTQ